ncbi:MAG TPA: DinB family protein [Vicinamibacterales bacterium]|nr:DinB family protein [Vicinamibacterales bacterium]
MALADALIPEFDHEMGTTRRLLDRVPEAEFGWKPHERSMTLGQLAGHLASIPMWCSATLRDTSVDLAAMGDAARPKPPTSRAALLRDYDAQVAAARALLAKSLDPELLVPWTLRSGDQVFFTMPRISAIRSFVMNHMIHHRGQLSVYLRLKDVPVPPIYGPTADEQ